LGENIMKLSGGFNRFVFCLFVFAIFAVLGSLVLAQEILPARGGPVGQNAPPAQALRRAMEGGEAPVEELLRALELPAVQKALVLTDEQRRKIEDISFNARRAAIQQEAALRVQRLELERMMRADNPDRAAIDKKIPEVAQAQTMIMRARINALMDLRGVLTKEQRDKIGEFVAQRVQQAARARAQQARPAPGAVQAAPAVPAAPLSPQPR
jgi:Spy/CpxP family protein refolding chaperone